MQLFDISQEIKFTKRVVAMTEISFFKRARKVSSMLAAAMLLGVAFAAPAQAADVVTTVKDADGWKASI